MIVEDTFTYSLGKPWAELNYGADLSPSLSFWLLCAYAFLAVVKEEYRLFTSELCYQGYSYSTMNH